MYIEFNTLPDTENKSSLCCIQGFINDKKMNWLIDSGSDVTIIDMNTAKICGIKDFDDAKFTPVGASNESLGTAYTAVCNISLGEHEVNFNGKSVYIVPYLPSKAILGRDLLKEVDVLMPANTDRIRINNVWFNFENIRSLGGIHLVQRIQIKTNDFIEIPPRCEKVIMTKTSYSNLNSYLIEPHPMFQSTHNILVGRILVNSDKDGLIPMKLLNPDNNSKVLLQCNTIIGELTPANVLDRNTDNKVDIIDKNKDHTISKILQKVKIGNKVISKDQYDDITKIISKNSAAFSLDDRVGHTDIVDHKIKLSDEQPVYCQPRRLSPEKKLALDKHLDHLLANDLVEEASGEWASPVVLVRKPDLSWRFVCDYRLLNTKTIKDNYPIPRVDEAKDCLLNSSYFGIIDMNNGFWQVQLNESSREFTSFTCHRGIFQWNDFQSVGSLKF